MTIPRGISWDDELAAYEATFEEDAPMQEKLAHLDRLAVGGMVQKYPRHVSWQGSIICGVVGTLLVIGVVWGLLVLGGVE